MPRFKSNSTMFANGVPAIRGPSEPKKVLGITLSFKSSKALKRDAGAVATPPIAAVEQSQASTVRPENRVYGQILAQQANHQPTFLYRGSRYLWGYTPDRQVCGMWDVGDRSGAPSRSWPISDHANAWAVFRSVEPLAVDYKEVDVPPPPPVALQPAPWTQGTPTATGQPWFSPSPNMPKTPAEKKPRGRLVVLLVLLVIVVAAGAVLGVKNLGSSGNTSTSTTSAPLSGVGSSHFCADFKSLLSMHSGAQSLTQGKASAAEANTLLGRLQNEPPSSLHYDVAYVARALIPLERAYLDLGTNPSSSQIQQLAPLSDRAFAALSSPQFQHVYSWAKANCPASERPPLSIGTGGPSGT